MTISVERILDRPWRAASFTLRMRKLRPRERTFPPDPRQHRAGVNRGLALPAQGRLPASCQVARETDTATQLPGPA